MQIFKKIEVSIYFFEYVLINSPASESSPPRTTINPYFQNFRNLCLNFRQNFNKIFKNFWKWQIFIKIIKNLQVFIDFST